MFIHTKKTKSFIPCNFSHPAASFTIEAALIMPIVLFVLASMIALGFALHDTALSNFTANEASELFSHLPEDEDTDTITVYSNERLEAILSGAELEISIEEYKDGSISTIKGAGRDRSFTDNGFRPESFMRKITVIEEVMDQ